MRVVGRNFDKFLWNFSLPNKRIKMGKQPFFTWIFPGFLKNVGL